ncbi:MAG: hypothetical protein Q9219_002925 [cf. Caloplaca sp. 3 TL-2023]
MAYFIPSYFQKRILRYALSRLDLLDAQQLDLDNLDIAWGKTSVLELRDIGIQLKKLASLLKLPAQLVLVKARIKLLRITIPADIYSNGIVAAIEGIDLQLEVQDLSRRPSTEQGSEVGNAGDEASQRRTHTDQPRTRLAQVHEQGGEPPEFDDGDRRGNDGSGIGSLPTTDDLAESFLQAEPKKEKAKLQAAVAQSQYLEGSRISDGSKQESPVGVGERLSLPTFLSAFLEGIRDRFCLTIKDATLDISLLIDVPSEVSSAIDTSNRSENVTLRFSLENVDYVNELQLDSAADAQTKNSGKVVPSSPIAGEGGHRWVRQIKLSNIRGAVLSDTSIFSNLLPSPNPSSTSESTFAGPPSRTRRRAQQGDPDLQETSATFSSSVEASVPPPDSIPLVTPMEIPQPGIPRKSVGGNEAFVENPVTIPTEQESDSASTVKQHTPKHSVTSEDVSLDEHESVIDFRSPREQTWPSPSESPVSSSIYSLGNVSTNFLRQRTPQQTSHHEKQPFRYDRQGSLSSAAAMGLSIGLQPTPSPPSEDLAGSRIFSHEEAESMYMSAMSTMKSAGKIDNQVMPGAWESHLEIEDAVTHIPPQENRNTDITDNEFRDPDSPSPERKGPDIASIQSLFSEETSTAPCAEAKHVTDSDEVTFTSERSSAQPTIAGSPDLLEVGVEGSLVVSRPFMLIDSIFIKIPHTNTCSALTSPTPHGTVPNPQLETPNQTTASVTSVFFGSVNFHTDMGLAKLTALVIRQMYKILPNQEHKEHQESSTTSSSPTEINMTVAKVAWHFYDRVIDSPIAEDLIHNAQPRMGGAFTDSDLLLQATIKGVECISRSTANSFYSELSIARFAFGYASDNILSFDSNIRLRQSTRDTFAPTDKDLVFTISKDPRVSKIEVNTLPVFVHLDLRRLDDTFAWLGGFSSILDLGNSMISTVTTLDLARSDRRRGAKVNRGVHFRPRYDGVPAKTDTKEEYVMRKVSARVGGLTCTLLGSESSLRIEATALKVVSRAEGFGLQIDQLNVRGLYPKSSIDHPPMVVRMFNVRMEYLPEPKEVDLARLLALLSPSKDKYEVDDDILLDTLLRQRRQGCVVRSTVERIETHILRVADLRYFSTLGEELKKLATVTKYLPEDDRPGVLTLALIRQFHSEAQIDQYFGHVEANINNIELAQITLPSLFALAISDVHVCRNKDEELVAAATPLERLEASALPMIMARFIGNEMEPTVKLKLYNLCIEYHVPFILAFMKLSDSLQIEEAMTDMAASIATLIEKKQSKAKESNSSQMTSVESIGLRDRISTLKVDITVRDSLLGLNPRKSSSKGIILLTETNFTGVMPKDQEANAILEVRKAALMVIDDQKNIKRPAMDAKTAIPQPRISQFQCLEAMGYVSVSSISAAQAVLQVTQDRKSSSRSIEVEIKDELFVLESCADSTQTLQEVLNGLAPPMPPSKDAKYRTEVVPIEDMLSSFSGMAFTSNGIGIQDDEEASSRLSTGQKTCDEEDLQSSLYNLEASRHYEGILDSMLDDETDSLIVDPSAPHLGETSSILGFDNQDQGLPEDLPLDFQDDHFGSNPSIGGTAHRWNTEHNTYGLSDELIIRRSPLRVKVRDVHIIWNLFDGYDWQRTRDTISQAIADVETEALNRESKREKRKPQEVEDDTESVIGDFLFNSIYIGVSANRDPRNLVQQVSRNLDEIASEPESSAATNTTNTPGRPNAASSARSKRPRLGRSKHHKMTFELKGISADLIVFPPGSGQTQSSIDIRVQDLDIYDHVPTSTWKKFATYMQDAGERESGSSMIHLEILKVRPVADLAASEIILKATILPLRLHVDQDALDFMTRFFEFRDSRAEEVTTKSEAVFLQRVEVNAVRLRLDFKPKRVDYAGIRSGHTNEFMNFFILDRANMVLRHVIIYGICGLDRLGKTLNDIWMPDIKKNQLPGVLAGLAPVRSIVNVGGGVRDLVVVPIREYQKDGRIVRSLQRGALAFAKTTTSEIVKLGAKLAIGTQTVLQGAEDLLVQPEQQRLEIGSGWEEAELDAEEKRKISLYADQPFGVIQGLRGAYASLERDLLTAKDAIVAMPGEVLESGTAGGAAKAVLKGAPTIILRPALGVSKAVGRTLMGATNSLDPENRRRIEEASKPLTKDTVCANPCPTAEIQETLISRISRGNDTHLMNVFWACI